MSAVSGVSMAKVYLSLGSNVARERNIGLAVRRLRERYGKLELSSVYESEAMGFEGRPFYNVAVGLVCDESPAQLVEVLRAIEDESGRTRNGVKYGPRTLDIDLLLYEDKVCSQKGLELPRDEVTRYAFVLRPLAEIAESVRHPTAGKTIGELWSEFDDSGQVTRRLDVDALGQNSFSGSTVGSPHGAPRSDRG